MRFARFHSVQDNRSKKNWFKSAHSSNCKKHFCSEAKVEYVRSPRAQRALAREVVSSMRKQLGLNGVHINIQHRRLTKSLKLTENTACCFAARHEFTKRQNAEITTQRFTTRAMSYDKPTTRCRSLAPVR